MLRLQFSIEMSTVVSNDEQYHSSQSILVMDGVSTIVGGTNDSSD
jgi:hypothetical protein